jgi:outer membrane protein assembly factor BamA
MKPLTPFAVTILVLLLVLPMHASAETRAEELGGLRFAHQQQLKPEADTRAEAFLRRLIDEKVLERINYGYNGLGAKLGGLVSGSGFALGPQYLRDDLRDGGLVVRAAAQISFRNYQKAEAQLVLPKLSGGRASFDLRAAHRNYPGINYYGPGPDSAKTRTNYRLEDTAFDGALSVSPFRFVKVGAAAGWLAVNIGPGADSRFISSDAVFTPQQAPGIDQQSSFFRYGAFAQFDWRDDALGPRNGGNYVVQYTRFEDRDLGRHDFNLIEVDLQQYIGFLNRSRVIALRAHTRLTDTRAGQSVPFYLQPVLGGSDDLRGFRPFRFSGNNSLLFSAEYRWAIFSGCDGALFVDGGKVFSRRGQLNFQDLEGSAGFGLRFNARNRTFLRLDVGFSHEGFQVWLKFNDIFQQRPLGTADSQPIL